MAITNQIRKLSNNQQKVVPCSTASLWLKGMIKIEQIDGRNGIKLGTGKKQINNPKNHSICSRKNIFQYYKAMIHIKAC